MALLSPTDIAHYREHGYLLHKRPLFDAAKQARLGAIFEEHLAQKGARLSDELDTPHFRDPRLLEFLLADEVLDLVEPIIGPDIALWSSHFICKDAHVGRATPWHEDSSYWQSRVDGFEQIITVWLAIDRSGKDNGCMRVIPGTHRNGFSDYESVDGSVNTFDTQVRGVNEDKAVYFALEPGECSLHDSRIIHGAAANTSAHRRCGYTMRYFSTNIKVTQDTDHNGQPFHVWLARGRDLAGNRYANR
jgi:ectoine hydroxylase-related dioxygenase (phytanoyl-CoA dioxygenase family)